MTERILSFRNLIYGEPSSPVVPQRAMKGGQADNPSLPSSLPSTMSGEPRRAAVIRGGQLTRNNGLNEADRSLLSAEMPTPLYPSCMQCKRFLIPGALYKNGWKDGILFCNRCLRDAHMAGYYAAEETISGREDTEERYS